MGIRVLKFKTRVLDGETACLLADDCAAALGMSREELLETAKTRDVHGIGPCVPEPEFNRLLLSRSPKDAGAVQLTSARTLAVEAESLAKMLPLELMLAKPQVEAMAKAAGLDAREYMETVEFPRALEKARQELLAVKDAWQQVEEYKDSLRHGLAAVSDIPFRKFELTLQHICLIGPEICLISTYYAGDGVFWEVDPEYMGDDAWQEAEQLPDGSLHIPSAGYTDGHFVMGKTAGRDFRNFTSSDNLRYCLENLPATQEWSDMLTLHQGGVNISADIRLLMKMLNGESLPGTYIFDGLPDIERISKIPSPGE